jgi:Holliday junction DNA helicase RuvB
MRDEFLDAAATEDEVVEEVGLRPRRLEEFVGQSELKEHLTVVLEAARRRGQAVDHLLFAGPPGLGKRPRRHRFRRDGVHLHRRRARRSNAP